MRFYRQNKTTVSGLESGLDTALLTAQEHRLIGSTPPLLSAESHPHIPQAVIEGRATIKEVARRRKEIESFCSHVASLMFGFEDPVRYGAVISLEDIDSMTGETVRDFQLVGILDTETGQTVRDTERLSGYRINPETTARLWLRDQPQIASERERI